MIRFIKPTLPLPAEWLPHLQPAYDAAWFTNFGPVHERFAAALTEKYGSAQRVAVPVANATAGLTALLIAFGVQGAVIVPSFTFAASAQAILHAGCTPLFCDVDPATWSLDPLCLERLLAEAGTGMVGAVMPVRSYGFAQDFSALEAVCRRHAVPMLIDSAAGLGGRLDDGGWIGQQGDAEVFSLHATKVFGIGEGGVVFCAPERVEALKVALNFGIRGATIGGRGLNGKLSEFHAAVGLAMLDHIDRHIDDRNRYVARYRALLAPLVEKGLVTLPQHAGRAPFQTFPLRLAEGLDAAAVLTLAAERGLELRRYYFPLLHRQPGFSDARQTTLSVSEALAPQMLCLPVYSEMEEGLPEQVVAILRECLQMPV